MKRLNVFITIILTLGLIVPTFAQQGSAELELKSSVPSASVGEEFTVDVLVKNPAAANIISVRSWLSYDTDVIEGVAVDTSASAFTLAAPGEDEFAVAEKRVKIGRSNISGGVTESEAVVAQVRFRVKTVEPVSTVISPYDYQVSELGHTNVNIIDGGFPLNILSEEPESVTITLNPGATPSAPVVETPVVETPAPTPTVNPNIGGSGFDATLPRPTGLKANTGSGYVDLQWDGVTDARVTGYNIYYGRTSGSYTRRRTVNINQARIDGLLNGETYYFAVTAFNTLSQEGDYSDEVGIIVNEPLSSTSPFAGLLDAYISRIPQQPQNGPLVSWLLFSAAGLSGTTVLRRKK